MIYSILTSDCDTLTSGWNRDYPGLLYTTSPQQCSWLQQPISNDDNLDPKRLSRQLKIFPEVLFNDCDWSIYIDANISLKQPATKFLELLEQSGKEMAFFIHPERDCLYEEGHAIVKLKKDSEAAVASHLEYYKRNGHPPHSGLVCGTVLVRKHTPAVKEFSRLWLKEYNERESRRDQLSLARMLFLTGISYLVLPGDLGNNNLMRRKRHGIQSE